MRQSDLASHGLALLCAILLAAPAHAQATPSKDAWADKSPHKSAFATVNGIRLHYLDWGGKGDALLFIPGAGGTAHVYDDIAPKLTDCFRVLALTRRGHGQSDKPETGYDVPTLVEDIRQFLDAMKIGRVTLIGYSAAGNELTHFAGVYPQRLNKLVYLDAAYNYPEYNALFAKYMPSLPKPPMPADMSRATFEDLKAYFMFQTRQVWSDAIEADIRESFVIRPDGTVGGEVKPPKVGATYNKDYNSYPADYTKVRAPVLSFYAMLGAVEETFPSSSSNLDGAGRARLQEFIDAANKAKREQAEHLRRSVAGARIVFMPNTIHHLFVQREDEVIREIRDFLLKKSGK